MLAAPEYAVGWLVMRTTSRLRMPLNLAIAAPLSKTFPALSGLKISPLLTCFAVDPKTRSTYSEAYEDLLKSPKYSDRAKLWVQRASKGSATLLRWAEGPIDKLGLPYYLVARASNVSTLVGATVASMHGMDMPALLSSWGLSCELQSEAGLLAFAAAVNAACTPMHFLGAIASVGLVERAASACWRTHCHQLNDIYEKHRADNPGEEIPPPSEDGLKYQFLVFGGLLVLAFDASVTLYIFRRISQSAVEKTAVVDDVSSLEGLDASDVKD